MTTPPVIRQSPAADLRPTTRRSLRFRRRSAEGLSSDASFVIRCDGVEIHRSARRHGVSDADILHAVDHPLVVVDVDPDADPPKVLVIGPDLSSNLLELFVLELADDRLLTIHAMPLRRSFQDLLPKPEDRDA